ncbi:hypothetical protein P6B95_40545 [Streptomyces atratus]|nr:hypothetical protein [Streptomyces atratus]WPW33031.1 hypothetical protein P6B95_40545 [Streptomyces atratus]
MTVYLVGTPARMPAARAPACSEVDVREVLMAFLAREPRLAPTAPDSC